MRYYSFILLLIPFFSFSQKEISLDSCIANAKRNYPLIRQNEVLKLNSKTKEQEINENWLPKLSFGAQATYQTEVVQFNIPGINTNFPHDQYIGSLNLDQTLFDGGQTSQQRKLEKLSLQIDVQKNEIELYKLIDRVNQLYVSILMARENIKLTEVFTEDLQNRKKNLVAGQKNGLVLESSIDEIDAELLKAAQNLIEAKANLVALYQNLNYYTNLSIGDQDEFSLIPIGGQNLKMEVTRPELKLIQLQEESLTERNKLNNRFALPRIAVGIAGNYGRPGPNFINQNLRFFGSANLSIKWNISSLYGLNRTHKQMEYNQDLLQIQREVFIFNLTSAQNTQQATIQAMKDVIEKDREIVEKRKRVTLSAASQLENGKIKVSDYLTQLNAEMTAQLNQKVHEIKWMNAVSSYNTTQGIENF